MKKGTKRGISVFYEKKYRRYCVRISAKLTGRKEQKTRYPVREYLPPDVVSLTEATPEQFAQAKAVARTEAQKFALAKAQAIGTPNQVTFLLSPSQTTDALSAFAITKGRVSLLKIAQDYVDRHFPVNTISVRAVIDEYKEIQKDTRGNAPATLGGLFPLLDRFKARFIKAPADPKEKAAFEKRLPTNFPSPKEDVFFSILQYADIKNFVATQPDRLSRNSQVSYLTTLRSLFWWALEKKYIGYDVFDGIELPKKTEMDIVSLSLTEVFRLLKAAACQEGRPMLAAIALAAFAGIRREELERLDWSAVYFSQLTIRISKSVSKVNTRRQIKLRANLLKWLMLCPNRSGPICPQNFGGRFTELVKQAGFVSPEGKSIYPKNALRHSFASYLYPVEGEGVVIEELGHSSPKMVRDHYNDLRFPDEGKAYFSIAPNSSLKALHTKEVQAGAHQGARCSA